MSVRMRHTRGHTKNRRSHHSLIEPRLSRCPKCSKFTIRHKACLNCGEYKGKEVITLTKKIAKKEEKQRKREKDK